MTSPDRTGEPSRRYVPEWINPVTARGLTLLVAGLVALTAKAFTERVLQWIVIVALVVLGLATVWSAVRTESRRYLELLTGALYLATAAFLVVFADPAVGVIAKAIGFVFGLVGFGVILRALRSRRVDENWVFNTVRGTIYIAAGVLIAVLPETIAGSLVLVVASAAIVTGAIMLAIGVTDPDASDVSPGDLGAFAKEWLSERDLGEEMRGEVIDSLYFEAPDSVQKQVGFWVLLVLSVAIATLGILADSTAVVIGAMLVAPLMTPIMGVSAGIVNGWVRRVSTSFATVVGGVVVAIGVSWLIATWTPQLIALSSNTQVLSRVSPTLIDMMIAVAAGAAGAYATIDKRVSSSITGVAIAVALVPPLAVVGVTLQDGAGSDALGAFLLFATNLVSIILVASIVFVVGGLAPIDQMRENSDKMRTIIGTVLLGAMIIIVPLAFTSEGIIVSANRQSEAQQLTSAWIGGEPGLRINRVSVRGTTVEVVITGQGDLPPIATLEESLQKEFTEQVEVIVEYFPSERLTSADQ
ncbi:MAG: DUF389 domain-containing protein [Acidimicrobiia bacterium]